MTPVVCAVIWDDNSDPPPASDAILCWRSYACGERISSVPRYLERHAERLRASYLGFIHDLGEYRIKGRRVIDHLDTGEGFSLWWMTHLAEKSPFKSRRIYDCLRLLALEEMLMEMAASDVTLVSEDRPLIQSVRRLCENLKLRFRSQLHGKRKRRWLLRGCYDALPFTLKGLISLRHVVSRWALRKTRSPQWFSGDNSLFICSYFIHLDRELCARGQFFSRQWESLPGTLHDHGRLINWVQLFMLSAAVPDIYTGLGWLRKFNSDARNQGCQAFLDGYLTWKVVLGALRHWLLLNVVGWRLRAIESAFRVRRSSVWLWPMLRDDWRTSIIGPTAMYNCLWLRLFDAAIGELPHQQTGLYLCENQAWERSLLHAWRKHGHGKIVGVQHATVPFWHLYYFDDPRSLTSREVCAMPLPDLLAVNGPAARQAFVGAGYPLERLYDVEALRYLNLSPMAAMRASLSASPKASASFASGSRAMRVLVLGDMIPESMRNFLFLVASAVAFLPPGYAFTFKPHPAYSVDLANYTEMHATETTESLHKILNRYDVAIAANSTSASVDAYVAGLPVIIDLSGSDLNLCPLRGQPGVAFVSTATELAEALEAIRRDATAAAFGGGELFFLDAKLPRWLALLPAFGPN